MTIQNNEEFQRLSLATTSQFKKIRPLPLLKKISSLHQYFKTKEDLSVRLFQSTIQFPFGKKEVLSIVLSLPVHPKSEKFSLDHLSRACQRCLPFIDIVTGSFFSYTYPDSDTNSLYLEIEKSNGTPLTRFEIALLSKKLPSTLESAIEKISSPLFINEEERLRLLLMLNDEINSPEDPPQTYISFLDKSETEIKFYAHIVYVSKETNPFTLPHSSTIVHFSQLQHSSVGHIEKHPKYALSFLAQIELSSFIQQDGSIDKRSAHNFLISYLETTTGTLREVNGGILKKEDSLFQEFVSLLTDEEKEDLFVAKILFDSLFPTSQRALIKSEHLLSMFKGVRYLQNNPQLHLHKNPFSFTFSRSPQTSIPPFLEEQTFAHMQIGKKEYFSLFCPNSQTSTKISLELQQIISPPPQQKNHIHLCLSNLPDSLDPRLCSTNSDASILHMLFEGLTRLDQNGIPQNAIAEDIILANDQCSYTFFLKPTYWSNGRAVTAHDFIYSWQQSLISKNNTQYAQLLFPIKNARLVQEGSLPLDALGLYFVSDRILKVLLEEPTPLFLSLCAHVTYHPVPSHIDQHSPDWSLFGSKRFLSNGPFTLEKWQRKKLIITKNKWYWDRSHVSLQRIEIEHSPKKGDILDEPPLSLENTKSYPSNSVFSLLTHTETTPFCSSKIRHAFSYATHRKALVSLYGNPTIEPAKSLLPTSMSTLHEALPFNPLLAKRLLSEGLQQLGLQHLPTIHIQTKYKEDVLLLKKMWEKILHVSVCIDTHSRSPSELQSTFLTPSVNDPLYQLSILGNMFSCDINNVLYMTDKKQKLAYVQQAEKALLDDMSAIPIFSLPKRVFKDHAIRNVSCPSGYIQLNHAYIDR